MERKRRADSDNRLADGASAISAEMCAGLRSLRDPVRARGAQQYFKNEIISLGIPASVLRNYVKEHVREIRAEWDLSDAIRLCDCLLREPEMDIRGAGILVLGAFKRKFTPALAPHADRWLGRQLDNWALVDGFCSSVLAPLLEKLPEMEASLTRWSGSNSIWHRRAALVALVPFARRAERLDLAYRLAAQHFSDPEDLIHKATGWLLREAGKTDMPRLGRFLVRHGPAIPRTALRYAIERFPASERADLLAATRSHTHARGDDLA